MLKEELKLIITFQTMNEALTMAHVCQVVEAPGRLLRISDALPSGCGLVWCAEAEDRELLVSVMQKYNLAYEHIREYLI